MNSSSVKNQYALIFSMVLLAGCTGTGKYIEDPQLNIIGSPISSREAINSLFKEIPTPYTINLCEADLTSKTCITDDGGISASGIGGIGLPLFLDMDGIVVSEASQIDNQITFKSKINTDINKIPPWCGNVEGNINVKENSMAGLTLSNFYCNWAVIGNVLTNVDLSIDNINLRSQSFTGYYKISFYGTGNGVGSGYYKAVITPQSSADNTQLD